MKIVPDRYPGWNQYPVYTISQCTQEEVDDFYRTCARLQISTFLLSSGGRHQTFQVETNHELFVLQWL